MFYAAFNSISVISQRQLTLFMSFLGFTSTRLGLWSVLPKDTPTKKPEDPVRLEPRTPCWIRRKCWLPAFVFSRIIFRSFNPFPKKPWFLRVSRTSLWKTEWEKEKLLIMSNFSFSHSVLYLFWEHSAIFIEFKIAVCKLVQFGEV